MAKKSTTCFGNSSKLPLTEYWSEGEASLAAETVAKLHQLDLKPYRCRGCDGWHLAPAHTFDNSYTSQCLDRDGRAKRAYPTREDAVRRARLRCQRVGISLEPYSCAACGEWHLTKGGC